MITIEVSRPDKSKAITVTQNILMYLCSSVSTILAKPWPVVVRANLFQREEEEKRFSFLWPDFSSERGPQWGKGIWFTVVWKRSSNGFDGVTLTAIQASLRFSTGIFEPTLALGKEKKGETIAEQVDLPLGMAQQRQYVRLKAHDVTDWQ